MTQTPEQLAATIAALEAQRALLGDAVVDTALAPLRDKLAALHAGAAQQLKQVSVLFVDVVGSTAMGQQLDPETIHAVMDGALERFTAVVQAQHGRVLQYTGDGMLAAFGTEEASEDDVESAIRAGLGIIVAAREHAPRVRQQHGVADFNVRAGVHTGRVLLGGGVDAEGSIRGATVNVAARMEQSAPPGRLRISHDSYRHVHGVFDGAGAGPDQRQGCGRAAAQLPGRRRTPARLARQPARRRWRAHAHGRARGRTAAAAQRVRDHRGRTAAARRHRGRRGRPGQEPAARRVPADAGPRSIAGC